MTRLSSNKITRASLRLQPREERILRLYHVWGFTDREIADMVQLTPGYVNILRHRAQKVVLKERERRKS